MDIVTFGLGVVVTLAVEFIAVIILSWRNSNDNK